MWTGATAKWVAMERCDGRVAALGDLSARVPDLAQRTIGPGVGARFSSSLRHWLSTTDLARCLGQPDTFSSSVPLPLPNVHRVQKLISGRCYGPIPLRGMVVLLVSILDVIWGARHARLVSDGVGGVVGACASHHRPDGRVAIQRCLGCCRWDAASQTTPRGLLAADTCRTGAPMSRGSTSRTPAFCSAASRARVQILAAGYDRSGMLKQYLCHKQ